MCEHEEFFIGLEKAYQDIVQAFIKRDDFTVCGAIYIITVKTDKDYFTCIEFKVTLPDKKPQIQRSRSLAGIRDIMTAHEIEKKCHFCELAETIPYIQENYNL